MYNYVYIYIISVSHTDIHCFNVFLLELDCGILRMIHWYKECGDRLGHSGISIPCIGTYQNTIIIYNQYNLPLPSVTYQQGPLWIN